MLKIDAIKNAQTRAPVDLNSLAKALGLEVNESFLDADVSGELTRDKNGQYQININSYNPPNRKRFTLAHEIGHYILHRQLVGDGLDDDRAYRSSSAGRYFNTRIGPVHETEANKFAAQLLMPTHLISELKTQGCSRADMAKRLGVSEHALAIRLGESYP